jgi:hypothetical protein
MIAPKRKSDTFYDFLAAYQLPLKGGATTAAYGLSSYVF